MVAYAFNIRTLEVKAADLLSSRTARAIQRNPITKISKQINKNNKREKEESWLDEMAQQVKVAFALELDDLNYIL